MNKSKENIVKAYFRGSNLQNWGSSGTPDWIKKIIIAISEAVDEIREKESKKPTPILQSVRTFNKAR